jgi:alpha-beta hydrolase superfamily lysophospholipase
MAQGTTTMQDANIDDSTFQLVMDQLEELAVTIIEEIRQRPAVAIALVAGVMGALIGARLAARHRAPAPVRAARKGKVQVGAAADLAGTAVKLMKNPIVRGVVFAAVERQLKRRLSL